MPRYRRQSSGTTYFFTVVAYRRRPIFCEPVFRSALRRAIETIRVTRPFTVDAWVLLPDHMHCIWTLPTDDDDYSTRWAEIKRDVFSACRERLRVDSVEQSWRSVYAWTRESTLRLFHHAVSDWRAASLLVKAQQC